MKAGIPSDGPDSLPAASGRVRSRKFRTCMKKLLSLPVRDEQARSELLAMGLDGKDADNYMLITLAVFRKAVGGDLKFIQELRQIISDNETEIDRKTGIAQLDKIRAQTDEIRHKLSPGDDGGQQYMAQFFDVLRSSAACGEENNDQGGEEV